MRAEQVVPHKGGGWVMRGTVEEWSLLYDEKGGPDCLHELYAEYIDGREIDAKPIGLWFNDVDGQDVIFQASRRGVEIIYDVR